MKRLLLLPFCFLFFTAFGQIDHELSVQFNYKFNTNSSISFNSSDHEHTDGSHLRFEQLYYYVSNIELTNSSGIVVPIDTILYIESTSTDLNFNIGDIPIGTYTQLRFDVGVDSALNHLDPSIYPLDHPLSFHSPNNFWTWNSGYIFMRLQAVIDTSASQTIGYDQNLAYHLGGDAMLRTVTLPLSFTVLNNTDSILIGLDLIASELLNGMDIKAGTDMITHTMDNMPTATKLANNIPNAFAIASVDTSLTNDTISSVRTLTDKSLVSIYPNPTQGLLHVQVYGHADLQLFDLQGKLAHQVSLEQNNSLVDINHLQQGMYLYRITLSNGQVANGKVLVE